MFYDNYTHYIDSREKRKCVELCYNWGINRTRNGHAS